MRKHKIGLRLCVEKKHSHNLQFSIINLLCWCKLIVINPRLVYSEFENSIKIQQISLIIQSRLALDKPLIKIIINPICLGFYFKLCEEEDEAKKDCLKADT